jgi:hypothetical protein
MLITDEATPSNTQAQTKHPAIAFLTSIFEPDDRVCIAAKKTVGEGFQTDFRTVKEICTEDYLNRLAEKNDAGLNIYVCMNAIRAGGARRRKEDIGEIRSVYLDLDADGQKKLDVIMSSKDVSTPTIVQESSTGKFQVIWSIRSISKELQESLLDALINTFGGDPAASDCSRVLRLPGFSNAKYEESPVVTIVQDNSARGAYSIGDFKIDVKTKTPQKPSLDVSSDGPEIPYGEHDRTLNRISGKLRSMGWEEEEIYNRLVKICENRIPTRGADWLEMVAKHSKNIVKKPAGQVDTVMIGGRFPGEVVIPVGTPTPSEPVIDTSEGSLRPVFPHHVMKGTTLYEGLVKPAVDNSSKHAEFVFVPAVQMMLNYLSGKVRIAMQETNLNLFVGLVSPPGEFFKSSSCALSHDYFKSMGLSAKYSKSLPNADGRVIVMQTGSSEGFGLTMSEINGKNAILFNDELGKLVAKAGIENSSLPHDLLTWYESGDFGNTVKSRKDSFAFEGKSYTFGWQWCTTTRGFNRHWPKIAGAVSGMEDRMFFVVSPEKPKPAGAYHVPPIEEAAKVTYSAIETATLKGVYEFAVWEDVNSIANGMNPRTMQMLFALALYFAIDLKRDKIDLDCLTRAKELVDFRDQSIRFLAPIEADNEQGRVQQEITRELRQNKGKMKTRDLSKELHAERYGTDRWKAAYWGLVKEGVIADFSEKSKSGQTCRMTALLVPND